MAFDSPSLQDCLRDIVGFGMGAKAEYAPMNAWRRRENRALYACVYDHVNASEDFWEFFIDGFDSWAPVSFPVHHIAVYPT